jgi:eukaryotic-like serine/threonine-protein kinase
MAFPAGTRLGPYEIVSALGAGGMGEVYRAHDERLQRDVAIKVLAARFTAMDQARERFQREARAVAALQHPNICAIYDVGQTTDGDVFLVMELLHGETLQQRVARSPLEVSLIVDVGIGLAEGLAAAHQAGVVHRDIKPANIILTDRGPKILDFGLAKSVLPDEADLTATAPVGALLTEPGITIGTAAYMSPEQLRGEGLDARSDLFSFGLVLYEMMTGGRAFAGATGAIIAGAILHDTPTPPRVVRPDLPERLDAIVLKLLEKDRRLRYQHADDVGRDLQRVRRDGEADGIESQRSPVSRQARWKVRAAYAAILLLGVAGAGYSLFTRPHALTAKDTLVLADFVNSTGDPVFDGTLRQGLSVQLGQSPVLNLLSEQRIQRTLALMGQPADARLTMQVAGEVCQRTGSTAVLDGSIANLGTQYVLALRATNCRTGEVVDQQQIQAARKEDVLNAMSRMASSFRKRVGESLATLQTHDTPLEEATTPSLEALKAFSAASKVLTAATDLPTAVLLFKRAIEIDPKFASAHASLGLTYELLGQTALSAESTRRAYELKDRATDQERFFITTSYDLQVTGNLERALETAELWTRTYPSDLHPYGFLGGFLYPTFGRFDKGVEVGKKMVEIDPDFPIGYLQLGFNYQFANRLSEAEDTFRRAAQRGLELPEIAIQRYDIAFLRGDQSTMRRELGLARGKTEAEDMFTAREGFVLAYGGHLREADARSRRAADLAEQNRQPFRVAVWTVGSALRDAFVGSRASAVKNGLEALNRSTDRDVEYGVAFAMALAGESSRASALSNDLERRFPEDTSVRATYLPTVRALLALNVGNPAAALTMLHDARYELGTPLCSAPGFFGILYPVYVRGLAYLAGHQGLQAAAEFQKILDHQTTVVSDPIGVLAHLQLARAFGQTGDTANARRAYKEFLALWKDADADIPILDEARGEYATLIR